MTRCRNGNCCSCYFRIRSGFALRVESLDLGWFSDERARDLVDHALALLAEKNELPLRELMDRVPEALRDALTAVEIAEGGDPDRIRQSLKDYALAIELRHLRRELLSAATPELHMEIHKRIRELNEKRSNSP